MCPYYEFVCEECEDKTPLTYKMPMSESHIKDVECWVCGGKAVKVPSFTIFELKGSGWFASGYTK